MSKEWLPDGYNGDNYESSALTKEDWIKEIDGLESYYNLIRDALKKATGENREMGHFINMSALISLHALLEQSTGLQKEKRILIPKVYDQELHNKIQLLCLMRNAYAHNNIYNSEDSNQLAIRNAVIEHFDCDPSEENWRDHEIPADRRKVVEPMFKAASQCEPAQSEGSWLGFLP